MHSAGVWFVNPLLGRRPAEEGVWGFARARVALRYLLCGRLLENPPATGRNLYNANASFLSPTCRLFNPHEPTRVECHPAVSGALVRHLDYRTALVHTLVFVCEVPVNDVERCPPARHGLVRTLAAARAGSREPGCERVYLRQLSRVPDDRLKLCR